MWGGIKEAVLRLRMERLESRLEYSRRCWVVEGGNERVWAGI